MNKESYHYNYCNVSNCAIIRQTNDETKKILFGFNDKHLLIIRNVLKDLFEGRKKINEDTCAIMQNDLNTVTPRNGILIENQPIIKTIGTKELQPFDEINLLIPFEMFEITSKKRSSFNGQDFVDFYARKGKNYAIGDYARKTFEKSQTTIIEAFEKKTKALFTNTQFKVNESILEKYLLHIENTLLCSNYDDNVELHEAYREYINTKKYAELLARVLLLITICTVHPEGKDKYREYDPFRHNRDYLGDILISDYYKYSNREEYSKEDINSKGFYLYIKNKYNIGDYNTSYRTLSSVIKLIKSNSIYYLDNKSNYQRKLHRLYALHLIKGLGCKQNLKEAIDFLENKDFKEDNAYIFYLLYEIYSGKNEESKAYINNSKALKYLDNAVKCAVRQDYFEPLAVKVESLLNQKENVSPEEILKYINQCGKTSGVNTYEVARNHYNKARYYELLGEYEKAFEEYKTATKFGHEAARKFLKRKEAIPREIKKYNYQSHSSNSDKICIINSLNEQTKALLNTLPDEYMIWSVGEESSFLFGNSASQSFTSIDKCIEAMFRIVFKNDSLNTNSKVLFALFSNEEERNIDASLQILDYLYNKALEKGCFSNLEFINIFDVFVKATFETASPLLDASLSDMNPEILFKTHICDSALMASRELLEKTPLFISEENKTSVLIIGNSKVCKKVFRESFAVGCMGKKREIDFIIANNDIEKTIRDIEDTMPYINSNLKSNPKVRFSNAEIPFMPKEKAKYDEAEAKAWKNMDFSQALYLANYIVIDVGNDIENINYAVKLRRWYARNYIQSRKDPIINVFCQSPTNEYWAERMALDNTQQGNSWHNSYRLHFFGGLKSSYSFNRLTNNNLEKMAVKIHCSYFDTDNKDIEALNALYSFSYNMDSSIVTALGLKYRFYIADCFKEDNTKYEITDSVKKQYKKWLEDNNEYACEIEQHRWNCFEISRGWSGVENQTDLEKYLNYPQLDNHKYSLAMLHPYIANWDDLDDDGSIFRTVDAFYHRLGKTKSSPKALTKQNVDKTLDWLEFEKEETLEQDNTKQQNETVEEIEKGE